MSFSHFPEGEDLFDIISSERRRDEKRMQAMGELQVRGWIHASGICPYKCSFHPLNFGCI